MATTAMRQESVLEQAKEGKSLWAKIKNILDTVAFELSPFFGPVFSNQPSREYLSKSGVREKTFVDSELRNK